MTCFITISFCEDVGPHFASKSSEMLCVPKPTKPVSSGFLWAMEGVDAQDQVQHHDQARAQAHAEAQQRSSGRRSRSRSRGADQQERIDPLC